MIEILDTSYSRHYKSFRKNDRAGLPFYFIRLQHEGQCKAYVKDHYETIRPGDLLLFKQGDPCELIVESNVYEDQRGKCLSSDYYISCRGSWLNDWWKMNDRLPKTSIPLDEGMLSIWKQLIAEMRMIKDSNEIAVHLMKAICLFIDRILIQLKMNSTQSGKSIAAYQIKYYIEQNAATKFKLEDVARYVGLSVSRIVHLFKQTYNQTITEYANQIRLSIACERIRYTSMSLESIAESVGFQSYTYFYRAFHARYGIPPKQYRISNKS